VGGFDGRAALRMIRKRFWTSSTPVGNRWTQRTPNDCLYPLSRILDEAR